MNLGRGRGGGEGRRRGERVREERGEEWRRRERGRERGEKGRSKDRGREEERAGRKMVRRNIHEEGGEKERGRRVGREGGPMSPTYPSPVLSNTANAVLISSSESVSFILRETMVTNSEKSTVPLPSASTSLIMSCSRQTPAMTVPQHKYIHTCCMY